MRDNISRYQSFVETVPYQYQSLVNLTDERTRLLQELYSKHSNTLDLNDLISNYLLDQRFFKGVHYAAISENQLQQSIWFWSDSKRKIMQKPITPGLLPSAYQNWCLKATQEKWGDWSEAFYLPFLDMNYGILYSIPLYTDLKKENLAGVLSIVIDLEWFRLQLDQLKGERTGDIMLLSGTGKYIVPPSNQYSINRSIKDDFSDEYSEDFKEKIIRSFLNIKSSYEKKGIEEINKQFYYFWNTIPITSWKIVYKVPSDIVEMESRGALWKIILVLVVVLSVLIGLFFVIIGYVFKPLRELADKRSQSREGAIRDEIILISDQIEELTRERNKISVELEKHSSQTKSISEQLKIAKHVQQSILPHGKIIHPSIKLAADLIPANKIGGDLYDYFMIDSHRLCVAIGDVSGHGIGASLYMAIAQTIIHRQAGFGISSSADIVERINNELCNEKNYELFLTLFFGVIDLNTGWFDYCNSGHSFPYILTSKSSKIQRLEETHGIPVGIYPNKKYSSTQIKINNNDILFAYTDGVVEERDQNNHLFSIERLEEILKNANKTEPEEIIFEIKGRLSTFRGTSEQSDDITLLAIKFLRRKVEVPVVGIN